MSVRCLSLPVSHWVCCMFAVNWDTDRHLTVQWLTWDKGFCHATCHEGLLYAYCHMWHRIDLLLITWSIINRLCLWHLRCENATTVQLTLLLFIRFRPILYYTIVNQLHDKSPSHMHMNKCNGNRAISPHKPLTGGYWWCVFLRPICRCRQGYRGPGTSCVEINRCLEPDRGGCHLQV